VLLVSLMETFVPSGPVTSIESACNAEIFAKHSSSATPGLPAAILPARLALRQVLLPALDWHRSAELAPWRTARKRLPALKLQQS